MVGNLYSLRQAHSLLRAKCLLGRFHLQNWSNHQATRVLYKPVLLLVSVPVSHFLKISTSTLTVTCPASIMLLIALVPIWKCVSRLLMNNIYIHTISSLKI